MGTIEPNNDAPAVFALQTDEAGDYPVHTDHPVRR